MRKLTGCLFALALSGACFAQQWELGGAGGIGIYKNLTVSRGSGEVTAGFKPGMIFSGYASQNLYEHLGGQFRYTQGFSKLKLSGNGTDTDFSARTHAFHYDLLFFAAKREAPMRPFIAAGGGMMLYRGVGKENLTQPLAQYAILTKTQQITGLISVGGGLKFKMGDRAFVTVEVRDYITPAPKDVIAPMTGSKLNGWVHGFMPMLGISISF